MKSLFLGPLALILTTSLLLAEAVDMPNGDFEDGTSGWAISPGASIVDASAPFGPKLDGRVLSLAEGTYANAYLDISPEPQTAYTFTVTLAPMQSELATVGKLTIFLHRGADTRNLAEAPVVWAAATPAADTVKTGRAEFVSNEVPDPGWKLGVQILAQNQGLFADAVEFQADPLPASIRLEGKFGRVEINPVRPELESLVLRRADGTLEPHSLLSPKGVPWMRSMPGWATQALTFAVDETGRRFESRNRAPESVEQTANGVTLRGVTLTDGAGEPVAKEDWTLKTEGDDLVWTVERAWLRELTTTSTGTPALFFSSRPINGNPSTVLPNAVATTFWIAPEKLSGWFNPFYRPGYDSNDFGKGWPMAAKLALENNVVVTEPGGWATLKLFTSWQNETEPRFGAEGGHLYRRGHFGWLSEAGVVSHPNAKRVFKAGEKEKTTLRIRAVPAAASGHQLTVKAEDPSDTIGTLRGFYGSLLNGGCVNDPLHYNFGNEPDGWYYGGASWMKGLPVLAGAPATDAGSSRPHELPRAFRDNLQMILGTEFEPGRTRFGYNTSGAYTDDNIIQVIGGRAYYLYSGDIAFVRQNLPFYRRAVAWYLGQRNADGLVSMSPAHWYYDAMPGSGVTSYHNAFLYRALLDLAGMERATGNIPEAVTHEKAAAKLKEAFNRVLWWEDAPGGPRYCDWITPDGTKIAYAADLCQFPPVAFGIASPEQGKKLIATIDKRIAELERENGYAGYASRSAYWPVPVSVNSHPANQGFGSYMNGGSFLCMTYWEIMARAAVGDADGAWNRLQKFAEGTRLTGEKGFIGNNWVMPDGSIGYGAGDEPFLSDAIAVPGALVQGILGIRQTNDKLEVKPVLPAALQKVSAEVVHLGLRKRVTIDGKNVKIEELGRAFTPPAELSWRVNAGSPPEAALYIDRTFEVGSGWTASPEIDIRPGVGVTLKRVSTSPLRGLWKLDDAPGDTVADGSEYAASGRIVGKVEFQSPDRHGKPGAARVQGGAHIAVGNVEPFAFKPTESFTIQAWFQTGVSENQVIAARTGAYSLGMKSGRLSAWIMQDGNQFVEAAGTADAADGKWHHAAAVFDRDAQTLTLYLDGEPDGVPQNIAGIGASSSPAPLTLGSFGGGFPFNGSLDEVSIRREALSPAGFSFPTDYPAAPLRHPGALTGTYTTAPCDWGQPVRITALRTSTALHDGSISARIETSHDGFKTIAAKQSVELKEGEQAAALKDLPPANQARMVFSFSTPESAKLSPLLSRMELTAKPQ